MKINPRLLTAGDTSEAIANHTHRASESSFLHRIKKPCRRMNILVVGETPYRKSGLGGCMREVFLRRISQLHNVEFACWIDDEKKCHHQISKYNHNMDGAWRHRQVQLENILKQKRYEIVITVGDPFYFEDIPDLKYKYDFKWIFWATIDGDPLGRFYKDVCFHADELVSFTWDGVRTIKRELPPARVSCVYAGYDKSQYFPLTMERRSEIRANNPCIRDRIIFLWAGQNTNRKQLPLFLNAAKMLKESLDEEIRSKIMFLVMAGIDDPAALNNAGLIAQRNELGEELHWFDMSPDKPVADDFISEWMGVSDFYVSTAVGEGFNMFMQQARACGLPVIVPMHTAMSEQAAPDGKRYETDRDGVVQCACGYGVTKNTAMPGELDFNRYIVNEHALVEAMKLGIDDVLNKNRDAWHRFRQNCISSTEPYSWDTIAEAFASLISNCEPRDRRFIKFEVV